MIAVMALIGCGKKASEQQANVPAANPPALPSLKKTEQPPAKPKEDAKQPSMKPKEEPNQPTFTPMVEPRSITLTPGIEAAEKAYAEGNNQEAVRLYTVELAAEEAKPAPSWVQLVFLHQELGRVLADAGKYDKELKHLKKALAIELKQLGPDHPDVAISYNNMAYVYKAKKDLAKAKEYWEKAYAIYLKKLGPNHLDTKDAKANLDALKE